MNRILICFWFVCHFFSAFAVENISSCDKGNLACENLSLTVFGDSMTWIGGEDCDNPRGWTYYFKRDLNPKTISIYARSGATLSNSFKTTRDPDFYSELLDDRNVVFNQVERFKNDLNSSLITHPDLVIVFAGGNDAWFSQKRPGCEDVALELLPQVATGDSPSKRTTLGESMALVVKNIQEVSPDTQILLITPLEMSKISVEKITALSDNIELVGRALGCDVLRADRLVDIRHKVEKKKPTHTTDGVHTNPEGARILSDVISSHVSENYCKR